MSAPILWIVIPFLTGVFIFLISSERYSAWVGGGVSAVLSAVAFFIPIDTALLLGTLSIKIAPAIQVFGRSFELNAADGLLLTIIYGLASLWFFGAKASGSQSRFVSFGLMIVALLTASIAVEPFLYAALLLEVAAMLVIPLLVPSYQRASQGVVRFLTYQTLAMPFILFSGWMLTGVEASPSDLGTTLQAGVMLALGFAFLFAVFPLYHWIPMLMEETPPYATGFLLWALPTFIAIFALGFLDRYTWLRNSPQLMSAIQFAGLFMVASGGIFAALQRHLGRILAYASISHTGLILLAFGLQSPQMAHLVFLTLIPRGLELAVWAFALSIIKRKAYSLQFSDVQGLSRIYPVATAALTFAHLSITGFPLLAGFPSRLALWQSLTNDLLLLFWVFVGMFGLLVAAMRTLAVFVMTEEPGWKLSEGWAQAVMLAVGVSGLFLLGIFPQILQPLLANIPSLFEHLGR